MQSNLQILTMKTTLRRPFLRAMTACLVMLSMSAQAQVPNPPTAIDASLVGANSFTANWQPVAGATSYRLDVSTSPTFGDPVLASDLIISEYVEGSTGYKAIEIYNGTGADVTLTGNYTLRREIDGTGTFAQAALTGVLANNSTRVIAYGVGIAADLQAVADQTSLATAGVYNFDGNDAIILRKNGVEIDIVGVMGQTTAWGADVTLRRKFTVTGPTTNYSAGDWDAYPMNDITDTGSHSMMNFIPSFVPGYEDLTVNGIVQSVSGLSPNTIYYYRVRAVNADGTSVNSNVIQVQTAPDAPVATAATSVGATSFTAN